ncbi:Mor transcription activator family protein [Methylicorpusculum sp.]|uniref:Mor transcription activator family protein n=1 Tax=Methylicorpusculum sp. TaxID=2713644 RepID=UPI00272F48CF|nr:Mor transcription activator family protein [Methylicorpusculum sp.]MDP2179773.1 Mor transcription activator family protein [Methylicorpusculum sp.]MDP3528459.1 Mor transcription activator family protein [Methylicorpusculum sp.]
MSLLNAGNRNKWPSIIIEIASFIGDENAILLFDNFAGRELIIPTKPTPEHTLEKIIGAEKFKLLCKEFQGELILIPNCASLKREQGNHKIIQDHSDGLSIGRLAVKYELTTRQITKILSGYKKSLRKRSEHDKSIDCKKQSI